MQRERRTRFSPQYDIRRFPTAKPPRKLFARMCCGERLLRKGKPIIFGNGGYATDANDWAIDCVLPPLGYRPVPAISLAIEPANITAVANDLGTEVIFLRQLIAQSRLREWLDGDDASS